MVALRESAVARHIFRDSAAITPSHIAFEHLSNLRGTHCLGARAIDKDGNFLGSRHRLGAAGPARGHEPRAHGEKFMPWWEDEFLETEYKMDVFPKWLLGAGLFIFLPTLSMIWTPVGSLPEDCPADSWSAKGKVHRALLWTPWFAIVLLSLVLRAYLPYMPRDTKVRLYPTMVVAWTISLYFAILWLGIVRELTRAAGGGFTNETLLGKCAHTRHVSVTTNFSTLVPTRTCIDRDPKRTVKEWPFLYSVGCAAQLVDCTFSRNLEVLFIFIFMRCHWRTAFLGNVITAAMLIFANMATGHYGMHMWCHAALQGLTVRILKSPLYSDFVLCIVHAALYSTCSRALTFENGTRGLCGKLSMLDCLAVCVYVCVCVCMYVCMIVCMYVCMYV